MPTTTINLLQNKAYPQLKRTHTILESGLHNGKMYTHPHPGIIKDLTKDIGVAIFGPTAKFVAQVSPDFDADPQLVADTISEKIHEVRKKCKCKDEELSAAIYGGVAYDCFTPFSEESCRLVDAIEEGCKKEDIVPTIISGQIKSDAPIGINTYAGKYYVTMWGKFIDQIKLTQNATKEQIQSILENFFEYVKLAPDVEIKPLEKLPPATSHLSKLK